jgi:hypothetical protein
MYFLFAGDHNYPGSPQYDYVGGFTSVEKAFAAAVRRRDQDTGVKLDWYQIAQLQGTELIFIEKGTL